MISTSTLINYAGIDSSMFGIISARASLPSYQSGLNIEVKYQKTTYIDKITFNGIEKSPLEFELELYKDSMWSMQDKYDIHAWLYQGEFTDMIFLNPSFDTPQAYQVEDIIFNCMPNGQPEALDFGGQYGLKIRFLCSLPYPTTRKIVQYKDLSQSAYTTVYGYQESYPTYPTLQYNQGMPYAEDVGQPKYFDIENPSNLNEQFYDIELKIELTGSSTGFSLKNLNGGNIVSFSGLNTGEVITMHNQLGIIESSTGLKRTNKWNKKWFCLMSGMNRIVVTGDCEITITGKFPFII